MHKYFSLVFALLLVSCASFPGDIEPFPHSPAQYEAASCEQISADSDRLNKRAEKLRQDIKNTAQNDIWQSMGGVVFWPLLLFLGKKMISEYRNTLM